MKKVILGIAIGILVSSVVAYAGTYLYTADEVGYTTSKNTSVNNVNDAINELYNRISDLESSSSTVYYLGTATSYDIKTLFPEIDYTKLTADNFVVTDRSGGGSSTVNSSCWAVGGSYTPATITYNSSTGVVTINPGVAQYQRKKESSSSWGYSKYNLVTDTYLIAGNIINKSN